jgi:hypothetical protein
MVVGEFLFHLIDYHRSTGKLALGAIVPIHDTKAPVEPQPNIPTSESEFIGRGLIKICTVAREARSAASKSKRCGSTSPVHAKYPIPGTCPYQFRFITIPFFSESRRVAGLSIVFPARLA